MCFVWFVHGNETYSASRNPGEIQEYDNTVPYQGIPCCTSYFKHSKI